MCICMYIYMYTHRCNICDKYSYPEKCLMMCHEPRDPCLLCSAQMLVGEIRWYRYDSGCGFAHVHAVDKRFLMPDRSQVNKTWKCSGASWQFQMFRQSWKRFPIFQVKVRNKDYASCVSVLPNLARNSVASVKPFHWYLTGLIWLCQEKDKDKKARKRTDDEYRLGQQTATKHASIRILFETCIHDLSAYARQPARGPTMLASTFFQNSKFH